MGGFLFHICNIRSVRLPIQQQRPKGRIGPCVGRTDKRTMCHTIISRRWGDKEYPRRIHWIGHFAPAMRIIAGCTACNGIGRGTDCVTIF